MRKLISTLLKSINLWIALGLLIANGLTWATALASIGPSYIAEPILEPSLDDLRNRLSREGTAASHSNSTSPIGKPPRVSPGPLTRTPRFPSATHASPSIQTPPKPGER